MSATDLQLKSPHNSSVLIEMVHVLVLLTVYLCLSSNIGSLKGDSSDVIESWETFKSEFNKSYSEEFVESKRKESFQENINFIKAHNAEFEAGKSSFKCGTNGLADLPQQLYLKMQVRLIPSAYTKTDNDVMVGSMLVDPLATPEELDWRTSGFVTPPCNQKSCGSCYAYSVAHSVSGQIFKRTGRIVMLSEQQIVDCSTAAGNHGCAGGSLRNTMKYLESSGGLMRAVDYPNTSEQNKCKELPALAVVNITSWAILPPNDEMTLQVAVSTIGPIAVSINATPKTFQLYKEGIYDDKECVSTLVNHAMLVVGYTKDYWILKNWWGARWGDDGYMKIKKGVNQCGITNFAAYAIV